MGGSSARRSRPLLIGCLAAAVATGTWVVATEAGERGSLTPRTIIGAPVALNRPAPVFTRPLLARSGSLDVGASSGSAVVVNFWASWCHACRVEARRLDALWRSYRDLGVRFVGVDFEDGRSAGLAAARSLGVGYPSVIDPNGTVASAFGIIGLPTTYIIGPDGRIRYLVTGTISPATFRTALDSVLVGTTAEGSSG